MKTIIFIIIITIITVIVSPAKAGAQQTIIISPPTVSHSLNPSEQTESVIKVRNASNTPLSFSATVYDFIVEDSNGAPHLLDPGTLSNRFSARSWITAYPQTFSLKPNDLQEVRYAIQPPSNARPGGHYAALLFSVKKETSITNSRTAVESNIGSLVLITIAGPIREEARIITFSTPLFREYGPVNVFLSIQNTGDLHIKPAGEFVLSDMFGRVIQKQSLAQTNIFPEASRDYQTTLGSKILLGRFKISLKASYGNKNLPLVASTYIWIIPWKILLLSLLSMIVLILSVIYIKKRSEFTNTSELSKYSDH